MHYGIDKLRKYLDLEGWRLERLAGRLDKASKTVDNSPVEIAIPNSMDLIDYEMRVDDLIESLSILEEKDRSVIEAEIMAVTMDRREHPMEKGEKLKRLRETEERESKIRRNAFLLLSITLLALGVILAGAWIVNAVWAVSDIVGRFIQIVFTVVVALGIGFLPLGVRHSLFEAHMRGIFDESLRDGTEKMLSDIKDRISNTAQELRDIMDIGVQKVFLNRQQGLDAFMDDHFHCTNRELPSHKKHLAIVGSSLIGVIGEHDSDGRCIRQSESQGKFCQRLSEALGNGWQAKLIMTHPAFADMRALAESRGSGEIRSEVISSLKYLLNNFEDEIKNGCMELLLYQGAPTMFVLMTSEAMLINPYLYTSTAMNNICIEIHPAPSIGSVSLYHAIYQSHVQQLWNSVCTTPVRSKEDLSYILNPPDSEPNLLRFLDKSGYLRRDLQERLEVPSAKDAE